jgi:integrase
MEEFSVEIRLSLRSSNFADVAPIEHLICLIRGMKPSCSVAPLPTEAPSDAIAGRIERTPASLPGVIDAWCISQRARGIRPNSVAACKQLVTAAAKERGWTEVKHLTGPEIMGWLEQKKADGWKAQTFNRNLSLFRSLSKWLRKNKLATDDVLIDEDRCPLDEEVGCRASTTAEARMLIRHAWLRCLSDRRSGSNRAAYWACLFLAGCRAGEPEQWKWKQLHLDCEIPHLQWTRAGQKNNRSAILALAPELAAILRGHREQMRSVALSKASSIRKPRKGPQVVRAVSPDDPEGFVFAITPPRTTFRDDRGAVGIAELDQYGRRFSCHSARKWFETTLTSAGVTQTRVDTLMRHTGHVRSRYDQPDLADQMTALRRLPLLWPERLPGIVDNSESVTFDLTNEGEIPDSRVARPDAIPQPNTTLSPSLPTKSGHPVLQPPSGGSVETGLQAVFGALQSGLGLQAAQPVGSTISDPENPVMPILGSEKVNPNDLADLLEALARLLKGAGHDGRPGSERRKSSG